MEIPQTQIAAALPSTGASPDVKIEIRSDYPVPSPAEGEVLVKLEFSGVCHSDVHSVRGETPMLTDVAGHEGVGRVVKGEEMSALYSLGHLNGLTMILF
jgi:propanol-preferring alcohol dehydrogenase